MADMFDMNDFLAQGFFGNEVVEKVVESDNESVEQEPEEPIQVESSKWDAYRIDEKAKKILREKFPEPTHIQHAFLSALPKHAVVSSPTVRLTFSFTI